MNRTHSEFDARRAIRGAGRASVLVLALVLSACASKSSGLAGRTSGDARSAVGTGSASGQKSLKSTDSSGNAQSGTGSASSLDANGSRRADASEAGRTGGAGGVGTAAGGPVDPMAGVVVRQVASADGSGASESTVMKSDADRAALAAAGGDAASRDADRLAAEARGGAGAGAGAGPGPGAAGGPGGSSAGTDGSSAGANGRDGSAAAGGAGADGTAGGSAAGGTGAGAGTGDSAGSTLAYADAKDPVAAALARAEAARLQGDSGAGTGLSSGNAGAAGGSATGAGSPAANGDGTDPVAEALRRAEQALRDARRDAEREAAERRGRVDTAGSNVKIEENERQQTLDGMLPMALDMDERGLFEFDRYELRNEVKSTLNLLAEKLKSAEYDRLVILGYTDRIGTDEYNRQLSDKRAWAVAGYLMDRGVPPHKLKVEGRGERDSITGDEACEGLKRAEMIQCLQRDRRVEIAATVKEYNLRVQ